MTDTLTSAIVDMNKDSAIAFLNEHCNFLYTEKMERYLEGVGELRREVDR